ncbi:hypothetical protein Pla22_01270 [Rubripirellula amarantea]|uniref:Uncharacterized protein n=1 Tax=Rubripirellula amarantea TaxID=2527999 RepID=A0A5C5WR37_9BACT|nr:hypothetical protein Pla22_01270 [Rubripirellula amarantea]
MTPYPCGASRIRGNLTNKPSGWPPIKVSGQLVTAGLHRITVIPNTVHSPAKTPLRATVVHNQKIPPNPTNLPLVQTTTY